MFPTLRITATSWPSCQLAFRSPRYLFHRLGRATVCGVSSCRVNRWVDVDCRVNRMEVDQHHGLFIGRSENRRGQCHPLLSRGLDGIAEGGNSAALTLAMSFHPSKNRVPITTSFFVTSSVLCSYSSNALCYYSSDALVPSSFQSAFD